MGATPFPVFVFYLVYFGYDAQSSPLEGEDGSSSASEMSQMGGISKSSAMRES